MRALIFLIQLILIVGAAIWLATNPGSVQIEWYGYQVQLSFALFVVSLFSGIVVLFLLYRFWRFIIGLPTHIHMLSLGKRTQKGVSALIEASTALALGDSLKAKAKALIVERYLDSPVLRLNIVSQAEILEENYHAAQKYLLRMRAHPEANLRALQGLTQIALKQGDFGKAYGYIQELMLESPKARWVLKTAFEVAIRLKKYDEMGDLLKRLSQAGFLNDAQEKHYRAVTLFEQTKDPLKTLERDEKRHLLEKAHDLASDLVPVTLMLVKLYKAQDYLRKAYKVIETTWSLTPHPELAAAYEALDPTGDPLQRLEKMQRLASFAPDHLQSHIIVVHAALQAQMWGKARASLKKLAETFGHTLTSCQLMAQLELGEKGDQANYRSWLEKALSAKSDARWMCTACHTPQSEWDAVCSSCHRFDTVKWI